VTRPFVVNVTTERRSPGVQRRVHVEGDLPDLGTSAAAVPAGAGISGDVLVEAMTDGRVTVTGSLRAPWRGECRRCLEAVEGEVDVDVQEVFEPHPSEEAETYPLDGDTVDLEPMVRDAVLLALPLAPLCEDDCAGPDPADHPVVVGDDADGDAEDPRWAALKELRFDPPSG
jgi:uncharacterized protein